ncbi:MAG TPA: substrate-binding domain-containing protein, partial [Euzebya sp.]|nr:substrate-binding domain-containing protein [Euzebya sp.]
MAQPLTLLVLSPSTGGYYFGGLLAGLTREVAAVGGRVVVVQTLEHGVHSDALGDPPDFDLPVGWAQIDGAVAVTTAVRGTYLAALQQAGTPVVVASTQLPGLESPAAIPDNHGGTVAVVEHLLAHGHTEIGFVGNLAQRDIRERHAACTTALAAHGLQLDPAHLFLARTNAERGGDEAAAAFLALPSRPTALVAATDRNAMGVLRTLASAGVRVPQDVAVVGFDNIEASAFTSPTLTTVNQPFDEVGALAGRLVLDQIAGVEVPNTPHASPGSLVRRGSCGCGTQEVALADTGTRPRPGIALPGEESANPAGTADRITRLLLTGGDTADQAVRARARDVVAQVDALMAADPDITPVRLDALTEAIRGLASRPTVLRHIARALDDHVQGAAGQPTSISRALWHLEAASFLTQSNRFERRLDEQVGIDGGLLDAGGTDPRDLSWLQGTHVVGGVLGLWDAAPGSGPLRLVGVHDPSGTIADLLGTSMPVEHFPPEPLVARARADLRQICYVVPVRT